MSDISQAIKPKRPYNRRADSVRPEPVRAEPVRQEGVRPTRTTRTRPGYQDTLGIPPELLAQFPDCDFQWVVDSVLGKPEVQARMGFEMNGWEPVPAELFDGRFMPRGHKGEINVGGLVLMWRQLELTIEARMEDSRAAKQALAAHESNIRSGRVEGISFDTNDPKARANTGVKREMVNPLTQQIATGMPVPK